MNQTKSVAIYKKGSFCEILVFVILSYASENIEELFFKNWNKELK